MPISKSLSKNQELRDLMKQANDLLDEVDAAHNRAKDQAILCGKALQAARDIVGHGSWGKFVRDNFKGSERTAQRYMRVYRAVAAGMDPKSYETLSELEEDITEEAWPPGDDRTPHRDDCEPDATIDPPPGYEVPPDPTIDLDEILGDAAGDAAPKPSKKKDVDLLAAAFRAIEKALNSVEGEKKAEWGKLLHAEVDLYMGPFEVEPKRSRKAAAKKPSRNGAPREPAPPASEADYEEEVEGEEYDFDSQEEYDEWNDEAQGGAALEPKPRDNGARKA